MMKMLAGCMLLLASPVFGQGVPRAEICASPGVLAQVTATLHRAGRVFSIDAADAGQIPSGDPAVVLCAIRVRTQVVDTARYGAVPRERLSVFEYALEMRQNGIFLTSRGEHGV